MKKVIVVNSLTDIEVMVPGVTVVTAREYLENKDAWLKEKCRVWNLCNDYKYQSRGYYVSLLAEARRHSVTPSVNAIEDLKYRRIFQTMSAEMNLMIQRTLKGLKSPTFTLSVYFGENFAKRYRTLCNELFSIFRIPLLKAEFARKGNDWKLENVSIISLKDIPPEHMPFLNTAAYTYFEKRSISTSRNLRHIYDLAILIDPAEKSPPSNQAALKKFEKAAHKNGFRTEYITKNDFCKLAEYDALLIRTTTAVNNYTYRFASRAVSENLAVIDDPVSIVRCSNKVYLAEAMQRAGAATPPTITISKHTMKNVVTHIGFPCVLKKPDSAFSSGVFKVNNEAELKSQTSKLFQDSDLLIVQKFMPTPFDWRIGVLNGEFLFACRYYMADNHWQIYNWSENDPDLQLGNCVCVSLKDTPDYVLKAALKAAKVIGDGLYGIDIKADNKRAWLIEINDNPNIDAGIEDLIEGDRVYERIIEFMKKKIESKRIGFKATVSQNNSVK